jgi:hypothetical protein
MGRSPSLRTRQAVLPHPALHGNPNIAGPLARSDRRERSKMKGAGQRGGMLT